MKTYSLRRRGRSERVGGPDLKIRSASRSRLVGATGSGKSTVAPAGALYTRNAGPRAVGRARRARASTRRRQGGAVALVFEEPFLSPRVCVRHPLWRAGCRDEAGAPAATHPGAAGFAPSFRTDTHGLGERGFSLSGADSDSESRSRARSPRSRGTRPRRPATSAVDATKEHEIRAALAKVIARADDPRDRAQARDHRAADRVAVPRDDASDEGTHCELVRRSASLSGAPDAPESEAA